MQKPKYLSRLTHQPLDLSREGCALERWSLEYDRYAFAQHPNGFKIFLAPHKIASSDEYKEGDPYGVAKNIKSPFQQQRIALSIQLLKEATQSIKGNIEVLDIGCGEGHLTQQLYRAIENAHFSGIDHSLSSIGYAHHHFSNIDFVVGDIHEMPYRSGFFDVVVCNNLWEHIPDPLQLLQKIREVLKPNGHLIISTPSRYRVGNLINVLRGKPIAFMSKHHVTEYSVGQIKEQLRYGGFEVIKITSKASSSQPLKIKIAYWLFSRWITWQHSHHQLESTLFYLAKAQSSHNS